MIIVDPNTRIKGSHCPVVLIKTSQDNEASEPKRTLVNNDYIQRHRRFVPMATLISRNALLRIQAKRRKITSRFLQKKQTSQSCSWFKIIFVLGTVLSLSSCAQMGINKQQVGTVTGAVLGGVLGSHVGQGAGRTAATIGGTLIGGMIGGSIGASMDKVDRLELNQALEKNRLNQSSSWQNPDNGNRYQVTPTRTYYRAQQPCREYHLNAVIGGETKQVYGQACRTANGQWRMVS